MSNVLGEPNFTPSNMTGRSGVGADQIGFLGSGVLQTIEEGEGAFNPSSFYYSKDVAYFQAPSLQRSHNDDRKTIPIRNFGARGSVTLTRRWMQMGPTFVRLQYPIEYAWAGCEYALKDLVETGLDYITEPLQSTSESTYHPAEGEDEPYVTTTTSTRFSHYESFANKLSRNRFIEVPGCDTILPTSFQSEGFGFATFSNVELDLGGAGRITYDRYSNWAAIMASCPFISQRKELMRLAGGGLDLRENDGGKNAPVLWGYVNGYNACGNRNNILTLMGKDTQSIPIKRYVPIMWDILVPIKTPSTNFVMNRKPLDTSCLAGDLQYTFTWSNFFEYTDTGCGYPNAPVYIPSQPNQLTSLSQMQTGGSPNSTTGWILPFIPETSITKSDLQCGIGAPYFQPMFKNSQIFNYNIPEDLLTYENGRIVACAPRIFTNHYRVASGKVLSSIDTLGVRARYVDANGIPLATATSGGRPRYPQIAHIVTNTSTNPSTITECFTSNQGAADLINKIGNISYPSAFTFAEVFNSSLKLTNPSLGAYNPLRTDRNAVLYYPFSYFYQQIYRITDTPFSNIINWNAANVATGATATERLYSDQNKITQLIQMPANPVTSMIVGIFREKDRKYLGKNTLNSYSPVLFWNALTPLRATLWDGGNVLFDYLSGNDYSSYSQIDRPDPLFVPFKGGCCKLQNSAIYSSISSSLVGGTFDRIKRSDPNVMGRIGRLLTSTAKATSYFTPDISVGLPNTGTSDLTFNSYPIDSVEIITDPLNVAHKKYQPCHLTEDYEACLLEFPFVMREPLMHEDMVQSTPSFAKTQLKFEFWISPKLKPDNNLDDHYDTTYGLTRGATSGMPLDTGFVASTLYPLYDFPGPISHPVPDCIRLGANPEHSDLTMRSSIASSSLSSGFTSNSQPFQYNNGFSFNTANSWNINNGALMLHVTFCQNQVWTMSPLHTSVLSARG